MVEAGPDCHMSKIAVVFCIIGLQIRNQLPCLIIIQALSGKFLCQADHIVSIVVIRPHNPGIIADLPLTGADIQRKIIRLIPYQKVLNGKNCRSTPFRTVPLRYIRALNQPVQRQVPHFIADSCYGIAIFRYLNPQFTVFRQHRDTVPGRLIAHVLHITVQAVDFFSI